jgi:SAM-dependent methyltransferase
MKNILREGKKTFRDVKVGINNILYDVVDSKVECNICHYKANSLASNAWHLHSSCPQCGSGVRHRLLWATFERLEAYSLKRIIENKTILHFAPDKTLGELIERNAKIYKKADFLADGYYFDHIDYNIDISDMPVIEDESFDCVIACDVLEHVSNDIKGIREVYRVLSKGGYCILTVPQRDNLEVTYEDPEIVTPEERKKAYGQTDHLRIYGNDFSKILQDCGFEVAVIDENSFSKDVVERNVLFPPLLSDNINATNYRKVFIGRK